MIFVLLANLAATLLMTGIAWFVQVVHYPLLAKVGAREFRGYEAAHRRLTGWVVTAPMLLELATAALLAWRPPPGVAAPLAWVGLALVAVVFASTFLLQVPQHDRLERGWDAAAHRRLVLGSWVRTTAWTVRSVLTLALVAAVAIRGGAGA